MGCHMKYAQHAAHNAKFEKKRLFRYSWRWHLRIKRPFHVVEGDRTPQSLPKGISNKMHLIWVIIIHFYWCITHIFLVMIVVINVKKLKGQSIFYVYPTPHTYQLLVVRYSTCDTRLCIKAILLRNIHYSIWIMSYARIDKCCWWSIKILSSNYQLKYGSTMRPLNHNN